MALIRIYEKPNAVPVNASVFILSTKVNGVWYDQKVTWEQLKGLIGALDNLENYYKKSETYTKTEVNQLIAQIPSFTVEIVQELPTEDISTTTLYLVPKTTAGTLDYYDEFINLDGTTSGWEYVGKTEVDLSNYYTKSETEAYVKGDGADYIAGTKTFSILPTTAKTILGAINEVAGVASGAQTDATQALSDASAAQGTANSASSAASAAQGTADSALTAAGNAASAASAAQGTANTALTTAQSMAVSVTNTLTPGDTTKKVADVTQNSTTTSIYGDDAEKVVVALTDTQTATGNPVTITTVQEGLAKSAVVEFNPIQDLHGQSAPYPAGGGKNKYSVLVGNDDWTGYNGGTSSGTDGVLSITSTSTNNSGVYTSNTNKLYIYVGSNTGVYTLSAYVKASANATFRMGFSGLSSQDFSITTAWQRISITVTLDGSAHSIIFYSRGDAVTYDIKDVQFESGETATPYAPYSNICPISGWDGLELTRTGKNIFHEIIEQGGVYSSGGLSSRSDRCRTTLIPVKEGVTYSASIKSNGNAQIIGAYFYNSSTASSGTFVDKATAEQGKPVSFTIAQGATHLLLLFANAESTSSDVTPSDVQELQVEVGKQATPYEPYQGETYTAAFPSTVMGGSYDFATGEGSETWDYIASYAGETLPGEWMSDRDVYAEGTTPTTGAEVAYKLATPTEISLTPADVNLLKGLNTVWTDGDTVQVKYSELPNGNLGAVIDYIQKLEARVKALES